MATNDLNFLMEDVSKELAAVHQSLRHKYVDFMPVLKSERSKITNTLTDMRDSLGSRLEMIDNDLDKEEANAVIDEITRLREESGRLHACRELLDKFSTIEATLEEMKWQLDHSTFKCAESIAFAESNLPTLEDLTSLKSAAWAEETTKSITKILYSRVALVRQGLIAKLNAWFKQVLVFPPSKVAAITQMNVCFDKGDEAVGNLRAMQNLEILHDYLIKASDGIMTNLVLPIIKSGGQAVVSTTTDPVNFALFIFRVRSKKVKRSEERVEEVFNQLSQVLSHLSSALADISIASNTLAALLMKTLLPQLQMAVLKYVISPRSASDAEFEHVLKLAEACREQMVESGLINAASPTFTAYAATHGKVFTDRKCITRLARARELIMAPYVDIVTVGYGEEQKDEDAFECELKVALGMTRKEAEQLVDKAYPSFFRLLTCQISKTIFDLMTLVKETVEEAVKAEREEIAGRLMLTARNMVEMFLLMTKSHSAVLKSVPMMAAIYHNNCHYIGHRLMLMVFDIGLETNKVIVDEYRAFFASFLVQLRTSAREVMTTQLMQIRRNLSTILADATMSKMSSLESASNASVKMIAGVGKVWKEVLPELVYCAAMSNIVGFMFGQVAKVILEVPDITAKDATFIAKTLATTLREVEKLFVIRGTPMLHKECAQPYFHLKEIAFMLNASLQDIADRWCDGRGPLSVHLTGAEVRHLVKALFANTEQRSRLLSSIF